MSGTLAELYRDLHELDAELMACRPARAAGSRWWDARMARRGRLRLQIDSAVKFRPAPRRLWAPAP